MNCWATFAMSLAGRDSPRQSFTQLVSLCSSRSTGKHQSRFTLYFEALIGAEMSCESASEPSKDFPLRIPLEYPTFVRAAQLFYPMRSLASFLIGIFLVSSLRAEEKFSMATTPGKLPKDVIPRAYFIHLEPNTDSLVTAGSESIEVEVTKPTDRIVINAVDTEFSQARLSGSHGSEELTPQIDSNAETVTFPTKTLLQPGSYQLSLTFQSKITEQPHGLFIQYFRIGNQLERLLSTHMEPTDARRLFPCWDEPAFRATYQLTVKAKKERHCHVEHAGSRRATSRSG